MEDWPWEKRLIQILIESDASESFFECITTSCSINTEGVDCTTAYYIEHLEPNNIAYPMKFS